MAVQVRCGGCGEDLTVEDDLSRTEARCPACGLMLMVPGRDSTGAAGGALEGGEEWTDWYIGPVKRPVPWVWFVGAAVGAFLVVAVAALLLAGGGATTDSAARPPEERAAAAAAPAADQPLERPAAPARVEGLARSVKPAPVAGPAARTRPRPSQAAPASRAFPSGPLEGELEAQVRRVLLACLREAVDSTRPGVTVIRPGDEMAATLEGHSYHGRAFGRFTVSVFRPGDLSFKQLYVKTTSAWRLSGDTVMPPDTYIACEDGRYEVLDMPRLRAEAHDRHVFINEAIARINRAAQQRHWPQARQILEEAQQRYPDSPALARRAEKLAEQERIVTITVVNRGGRPLRLQLSQGGTVAVNLHLDRAETAKFDIEKGDYVGTWGAGAGATVEGVSIADSETWGLVADDIRRGPGVPKLPSWRRRLEFPGARGGPQPIPRPRR